MFYFFMTITFISTTKDLETLCQTIKNNTNGSIGFDTEFIRESTYRPILCLIQLSLENQIILIDPLSENICLAPLKDIMRDENILKICHSARQDCEIFNHLFGAPPLSVFDTQIAASFLNIGENIGFQALVFEVFGKNLDKTHQHTNWAARPLLPQQIDYAAQDVADLAALHSHLQSKLQENNTLAEALAQMKILSDPQTYEINKDKLIKKIKFPRSLKSNQKSLLEKIILWREEKAQMLNVNRGRVLTDKDIMEIVLNKNLPSRPPQEKNSKSFFIEELFDFLADELKEADSAHQE